MTTDGGVIGRLLKTQTDTESNRVDSQSESISDRSVICLGGVVTGVTKLATIPLESETDGIGC